MLNSWAVVNLILYEGGQLLVNGKFDYVVDVKFFSCGVSVILHVVDK